MKEALRFLAGMTVLAPVLAAEDVLRYFGVDVPEKGITKNTEGKGIWEIWKESSTHPAQKTESKSKTRREIYEEQYRISVKTDEDKDAGSFNASLNVQRL